jgi:hypothetical protein
MANAAWTWMIYLATHNNVASAGEQSIERMRRASLDANVRVLVQQATPARSVRLEIGGDPELVADLGRVDSGEPATVIDFVRWAAEQAPADRYALVLWSHGTGWEPSEMARVAAQQPAVTPVTTTELTQRSSDEEARQIFFTPSLREILARPTPPERAIAFDDGSGHSLDTVDLGQVASAAAQVLGGPIDLLGMNACQMSNAEVAYELREHARVFVASQEDMPVQSLPYDEILSALSAAPGTTAAELGRMIVTSYCAHFRNNPLEWGKRGLPRGVTLAAVDLARAGSLTDVVGPLATVLRERVGEQIRPVWAAHRAAHRFKFRLFDLASFCRGLLAQPELDQPIAVAAQDVLDLIHGPELLLAREHTDPFYDNTGGLTTYLMPPTPGKRLSPYYEQTRYAAATGWGTFLAAYHAATR